MSSGEAYLIPCIILLTSSSNAEVGRGLFYLKHLFYVGGSVILMRGQRPMSLCDPMGAFSVLSFHLSEFRICREFSH